MAETVLLAGRNYDLESMGGNLQFVAKRERSEKEWKSERGQAPKEARSFFSAEFYFKLTSAFSGFVVKDTHGAVAALRCLCYIISPPCEKKG